MGRQVARDPLRNVIIVGNGVKEVKANLIVFEVVGGYAIVYNRDGLSKLDLEK